MTTLLVGPGLPGKGSDGRRCALGPEVGLDGGEARGQRRGAARDAAASARRDLQPATLCQGLHR